MMEIARVPASERRFNESLPSLIYADTDFFISVLFSTQAHHIRALTFVERLLRERSTRLVLSSLLWTEFGHAISREPFRQELQR